MSAAVARGTHRLWDSPPWIVDDPFALVLVGPEWPRFAAGIRSLMPPDVFRRGHLFVQMRSRYCEDRFLASGVSQYVILGAGLDAFAWRRPDVLSRARVFEVDHPATQAWKRDRATTLGLPASESHVFVAANLATDTVEPALAAAGFDMTRPAVFSWVGTTMYLAAGATSHLLGLVARCAPGSEVAFSYNVTPDFMDDAGRAYLAALSPALSDQGEPVVSGFAPPAVEALIAASGLKVVDHPTSEVLWQRYCSDRAEATRPYTVERLVTARYEVSGRQDR